MVLANMPGYSETFIRSLIEQLTKAGHEVILFTDGAENERIEGCEVICGYSKRNPVGGALFILSSLILTIVTKPKVLFKFFGLEKSLGISYSALFKRYVKNAHILRYSCDKLHFTFSTLMLGRENVALAKGIQSSISMRGFDMYVFPVKNPGCYNQLFKSIDKVHSISQNLVDTARQHGLSESVPVSVIPPAVNNTLLDKKSLAASEDLKDQVLNIVTVGRAHWMKGGEDMLHGLQELMQSGVPFTFKWIGDGPDMERLQFAAKQLGLGDRAKFLGKLSHKQTTEEVAASDVYLQYSYKEGFCNAVLEAQALAKLCIVSNGGALSENVLDGETGWVLKERTPSSLAKKIAELTKMSKVELEGLRKNAHVRVAEDFNLEKQRAEFIKFFES